MIAVVWQFDVREGRQEEFERFYGADGPWTALSRRSRSFLGSSFLKALAQPDRYIVATSKPSGFTRDPRRDHGPSGLVQRARRPGSLRSHLVTTQRTLTAPRRPATADRLPPVVGRSPSTADRRNASATHAR